MSAQREQELGAGGDEVKINEIKIASANKKPVLKDLTEEQPLEDDEDLETVTMTTRHNEKYICTIPRLVTRYFKDENWRLKLKTMKDAFILCAALKSDFVLGRVRSNA